MDQSKFKQVGIKPTKNPRLIALEIWILIFYKHKKFEQIIDIIIVYKQANPKKNIYLNEKCVKEAINFMNTTGRQFASQLGLNNSNDED